MWPWRSWVRLPLFTPLIPFGGEAPSKLAYVLQMADSLLTGEVACGKISLACNLGVSPSGKARDFDSRIRRFKSCYPSHPDPLAQSVEHLTFNQGVRSSNLRWITIWTFAGVAELADALDLGSNANRRGSSSLFARTKRNVQAVVAQW